MTSPPWRKASWAAQRKVKTARATSRRASLMGFLTSAQMIRAKSSQRCSRPSEMRVRIAARSCAGMAAVRAAAAAMRPASGAAWSDENS
jgi:hypothetical protein